MVKWAKSQFQANTFNPSKTLHAPSNDQTMSIFPTFVSPGVDTVDPAGHSRNHVINVNMVGHGPGAAYEDAAWVP